ncbi:MAG: 6-phosphofructokinase [Chloroflexi bacterium]|nr:6-phosphofructokinase [Chloroflexota bacterium]MBE3114267.1 6-phosphofructokinase [Actinomycetota bacterium]
MNAVIRTVARYAIYNNLKVYGFYEGFKGLINNDFKVLDLNSVGGIIDRGGTFLYSARSEEFKSRKGQKSAIDNLKKNKIEGLVVIGGDGSFRGAHELHKQGIQVVGIPATIDNDVAGTDYSIGFDTALNVIIDIMSKIRDTASSHERIFVVEVMGRNSGMIAVNTGIACGADYILIPEIEFDLVKIASQIKNHREGKRHTLVVVAEGAASASDVASSIKLLAGHEVRISVLGYIQRGGSPSALDRILAAGFGKKAVDLLLEGESDCMIGIKSMKIETSKFEDILEIKKSINEDLYRLAHILAL